MSTGWKASWSTKTSANPSERAYQQLSARGRASAADAPAQVALLQAVPQRRLRHLPRPGRLHAVPAGQRDRDGDPRDQLRAARRPAGDEGGALPQLAHQPPGQCRGHGADHAASSWACSRPTYVAGPLGHERSVPAQLRAEAAAADSRGAAGAASAAGLDRARIEAAHHRRGSARPTPAAPGPTGWLRARCRKVAEGDEQQRRQATISARAEPSLAELPRGQRAGEDRATSDRHGRQAG